MTTPRTDKVEELAAENHRLRIALHEAINRPKGIVPHEAEEFYDQDFYSNNSEAASPPSKLRKLTREQRRELAKEGAKMTGLLYHQNPEELLPYLFDLHEEDLDFNQSAQ